MAELADALDLGSSGETHGGSNPPSRNSQLRNDLRESFASSTILWTLKFRATVLRSAVQRRCIVRSQSVSFNRRLVFEDSAQRSRYTPLDTLTKAVPGEDRAQGRPVGRMQIDLRVRPTKAGEFPTADSRVHILTETRTVLLSGIVIRETRPGWTTLELPPLEAWEQPLRWVTPVERERIESPQFYRLPEHHLTAKFLAQRMGTG